MVLLPFFDILSGFQLGKITEECPFQGPVFFDFVKIGHPKEQSHIKNMNLLNKNA